MATSIVRGRQIKPIHAAVAFIIVVVVTRGVFESLNMQTTPRMVGNKGGEDASHVPPHEIPLQQHFAKEKSLLGKLEKEKYLQGNLQHAEERKRQSQIEQFRNQWNRGDAFQELIAKPDFDFRLSKGSQSVVLIASDPGHLRQYARNILTVDCYCRVHGLQLWVVPSDHSMFVHCHTKKGFFFGRHCISASVLEWNRDALEMLLVLDGDIAVVNMQFDIRTFLPGHKEMALAMRCHNQEISASSYLVRNTDFTIEFLKKWHAFDFPWNGDNGALHALLLDAMEIEDTCTKVGEGKLYMNYLRCFHALVRRSNCSHNFFKQVIVWQHFDGWEYDGWTVNYTWSRGLTFMHHAMKNPPIVRDSRTRWPPRFHDCRPGGAAVEYVDEFLVTDAKMNESMNLKLEQWRRSWQELRFGTMQSCLWSKRSDHEWTTWRRKTSKMVQAPTSNFDGLAEQVRDGGAKFRSYELARHSSVLGRQESSQYYLISEEETEEAKLAVPPVVGTYFAKIAARIKKARANYVGHVGTNGPQMQTYIQALRFFKTLDRINVCETGFNAGHSASLFLSTLPSVQYYGWDLGELSSAMVVYQMLEEDFRGRITVTWGDSRKTVPAFFADNPGLACHLVVVDGEHSTAAVQADSTEFHKHLSAEWVMFCDDCLLPDGKVSGLMRGFDRSFAQEPFIHSVAFRNPVTPSPGFCMKSNFLMLGPEAAEVKWNSTLSAGDLPAVFLE